MLKYKRPHCLGRTVGACIGITLPYAVSFTLPEYHISQSGTRDLMSENELDKSSEPSDQREPFWAEAGRIIDERFGPSNEKLISEIRNAVSKITTVPRKSSLNKPPKSDNGSNSKKAPTEESIGQTDESKHRPLKCNQWLFVEYFDNDRTNLKELKDEWQRIHKEEDFRTPVQNPIASMRTAINEERERRNQT